MALYDPTEVPVDLDPEVGCEGALYEALWGLADAPNAHVIDTLVTHDGKPGITRFRRVQMSPQAAHRVGFDPRWLNLDPEPKKLGPHAQDEQHGVFLGTIGDVAFFVVPEV